MGCCVFNRRISILGKKKCMTFPRKKYNYKAWVFILCLCICIYPLEKEMATHSSILAWIIPWTEEPSGLQTMGWLKTHSLIYVGTPVFSKLKFKMKMFLDDAII